MGDSNIRYYPKDEVDAYVNSLKEQICKLEDSLVLSYEDRLWQKYKRCKNMADACHLLYCRYERYTIDYNIIGPTMERWKYLKAHFDKWRDRWQELAKKFKEELDG